MEKIKANIIGKGKRWQKNGMDRVYLDFRKIEEIEVDERFLTCYLNRYERGNVKIYWDMISDDLHIERVRPEGVEAIKEALAQM